MLKSYDFFALVVRYNQLEHSMLLPERLLFKIERLIISIGIGSMRKLNLNVGMSQQRVTQN